MISLLTVYLLCLAAGFCVQQKLLLEGLLDRVLCLVTLAAAQCLVSIQVLSLFFALTPAGLLLANAGLSAVVILLSRPMPRPQRPSWAELWLRLKTESRACSDPLTMVLLGVAVVAMVAHAAFGLLGAPLGDIYHFEMPLYWKMNHSIAPFPVHNPRVIAVSFAGEGLAFPGYLYLNSPVMFFALSLLAAGLAMAAVFGSARRLGFSLAASACTAAILLGFTDFAMNFLSIRAGSYLAVLWAASALLFLLEARHQSSLSKAQLTLLGGSAFFMAMCFGAKNSMTMILPGYGLAVVYALGRDFFRLKPVSIMTGAALVAALCSGAVWNYSHNLSWYGSLQGPQFLRSFTSHDFHARAAWTRVLRGASLLCADTIYIPKSLRPVYVKAIQAGTRLLGAEPVLSEDDDFFNFSPAAITPQRGLGIMGILFFLPAMVLALWRSVCLFRGPYGWMQRPDLLIVIAMALGAFITCHVVFRWQWLGVLRLMPAFGVLGAPLCAALLEKRWQKLLALVVLVASTGMFFMSDLSMVARRVPFLADGFASRVISRLAKDHSMTAEYCGPDGVWKPMLIHEDYTQRELLQKFVDSVPSGSTIAFIGHESFESYYLFGRDFLNRVISLEDDRHPGAILDLPLHTDYVLVANPTEKTENWTRARQLVHVFDARAGGKTLLEAFAPKKN